jgi:hypothetical protein
MGRSSYTPKTPKNPPPRRRDPWGKFGIEEIKTPTEDDLM